MLQFYIEVVGDFKSEELYERVRPFGGNVMDLIEKVYAHGKATPAAFLQIMTICLEYGKIHVDVYKL